MYYREIAVKKRVDFKRLIGLTALAAALTMGLTGCSADELSGGLLSLEGLLRDMYRAALEIIYYEEPQKDEAETAEVTIPSDITNTYTTVVSDELYGFKSLTDEGQQVYNELLSCILNHEESCEVSTLDENLLQHVYTVLQCDHGELFWTKGYEFRTTMLADSPIKIEFMPVYTMSLLEQENLEKQIEETAAEWLSDLPETASDYEKTKYVFDFLIDNVDYDASAPNNQNIISVFVGRATVCQGFAAATQYLLRQVGIEATIITGQAGGDGHAWNLVNLSGNYYYTDTTWGKGRRGSEYGEEEEFKNYTYLNMTTEDIARTHTFDDIFELPECNLMNDNYFYREGLYFKTLDREVMGGVFKKAYEKGEDAVIKLATDSLYEETLKYFVEEQHILDYCPDMDMIVYERDESARTLMMRLSKKDEDSKVEDLAGGE